MHSRKSLSAMALFSLAALAAIPARATQFTTSRFEIAFPDGWQTLSAPGTGDTLLAVFSQDPMAFSWMSVTITDHPLTAQEIDAYRQIYAGSDSVKKVADGTKTLGGKDFTYIEYEAIDTTDGNGRVRLYYTASGNQFFTSLLSYDPAAGGTDAIAEMETALATLRLTGTPIRAWSARSPLAFRRGDHDVLGRARSALDRTRLFPMPGR